jgi:hypothetical protein
VVAQYDQSTTAGDFFAVNVPKFSQNGASVNLDIVFGGSHPVLDEGRTDQYYGILSPAYQMHLSFQPSNLNPNAPYKCFA